MKELSPEPLARKINFEDSTGNEGIDEETAKDRARGSEESESTR